MQNDRTRDGHVQRVHGILVGSSYPWYEPVGGLSTIYR